MVSKTMVAADAVLLPHDPLVVGICRGDLKLLGGRIQDRLLYIVRTVGQAGHLNRQGHYILRIVEICVDLQGADFFGRRVERERHLIAGLGIVFEYDPNGW